MWARRLVFTALLISFRPAAAQRRCKLANVKRSDGSFTLVGCDELLLFGEKVGDEGAMEIAKALSSDRSLKLLDLWSNGVGPRGAAALAEALAQNTVLQKLYLNENKLGAEGAASMAKAIASNRALTSLWLSRNGIGDAGAEALAEQLRNNRARRLEALDLWGNGITSRGGMLLAEALHSNRMLRTLELRDNGESGHSRHAARPAGSMADPVLFRARPNRSRRRYGQGLCGDDAAKHRPVDTRPDCHRDHRRRRDRSQGGPQGINREPVSCAVC